jgi:Sec-independent protein translocase protein TatA
VLSNPVRVCGGSLKTFSSVMQNHNEKNHNEKNHNEKNHNEKNHNEKDHNEKKSQ